MTRDEAICRWRDLEHSTVLTRDQARQEAESIRLQVMIDDVYDVDAWTAYRQAQGLSTDPDSDGDRPHEPA